MIKAPGVWELIPNFAGIMLDLFKGIVASNRFLGKELLNWFSSPIGISDVNLL